MECAFGRTVNLKDQHIMSKKLLDINVAAKNLWGIALRGNLGYFCYHYHGRVSLAFQTASEALRLLPRRVGIFIPKGMAQLAMGLSFYAKVTV